MEPSDEALEAALANYAHSAWAGWMKYLFSKGEMQTDGTWLMPAWAVERWTRQMNTPYSYLVNSEQKSDIKEAKEIMVIVDDHTAALRAEVEALRTRVGAIEAAWGDLHELDMGDSYVIRDDHFEAFWKVIDPSGYHSIFRNIPTE